MNYRRIALLLAVLLALGTAAFAQESAQDNSGLLATVNGVQVPVADAYAEYQYYEMIYQYYGYTAEEIEVLKREIADYYIELELIRQQYVKLGLDKELNMDALRAEASDAYEEAAVEYLVYVNDEGMTEEQAIAAAKAMLDEDGYDLEYFERMLYDNECIAAVMSYYEKDAAVTDEDVRAYYDTLVAQDKQLGEEDPLYYEVMTGYGERVMYVPEGYRAVKHILVMLDEDKQTELASLEIQLETVESALATEGIDSAALRQQKADLEQKIDDIYATIDPTVQEVMNKLTQGADFLTLIDEYGEDPGMTYEPYKTEGYLIHPESQQWVIEFRDAASALEKPGDISAPVRVSYGIHIIRYEYDVPAGAADFDELYEELLAEVSVEKFDSYFDSLLNQWRAESEIEVYMENLEGEEAKG